MENKFNILVCDDDKSIVDAIEIYLKQENYNVIKAYNGLEALQALEENEIHLILLDVMMPKMDGLNTTVKIRETLNIPIIILSAKSEDTDKILGLNFGADDYITKPFNPLELLARVKSQMRRYTSLGSIAEKSNVIKIGGLELDKDAKEVRVEGEPVKLTATEYGILQLLMENAGKYSPLIRFMKKYGMNYLSHRKIRFLCIFVVFVKNRDQSERAKVFEGGVGYWLQNRKNLSCIRLAGRYVLPVYSLSWRW